MIRISPVARITVGLVLLTVSMLYTADMIGLAPNEITATVNARKQIAEALAVQLSVFAQYDMTDAMQQAIDALVVRNEDVVSAALRTEGRGIVAQAGDHGAHWVANPEGKSTPEHLQVPIFSGENRWGNLETTFLSQAGTGLPGAKGGSLLKLSVFVVVAGFAGYFLFIKRVLRELDPSKVIPARVKATLDALAEGVVILDEDGQIVLANATFADKAELSSQGLIGKRIASMIWEDPMTGTQATQLPWQRAMSEGKSRTGVPLALRTGPAEALTFMVNASPILDGKGKLRGAMATFDDVTELERKNSELAEAMELLKTSQREVEKTNVRLKKLATEDPLTGCLNRRELFSRGEALLRDARQNGGEFACIMGDIDHFKRINDTYGHAKGDEVIRKVADAMKSTMREDDPLGRYGGEEFCIFLHASSLEKAKWIAERIRGRIQALDSDVSVTSSFGVTSLGCGADTLADLIDQADEALYHSKHNGRNRVTDWVSAKKSAEEANATQRSPATGSSAERRESADNPEEGPIFSRLAYDPRFRPIIGRFVSQIEEQLSALERSWKRKDFKHVIQLAHWFKGDGGTVGFDVFSESAHELEQLAREGEQAGMGEAIAKLRALGRRVVVSDPDAGKGKIGAAPAKQSGAQHEAPDAMSRAMANADRQRETTTVSGAGRWLSASNGSRACSVAGEPVRRKASA